METIINSPVILYRLSQSKYWFSINPFFDKDLENNTQILFFNPPKELEKEQAYLIDQTDIKLIGVQLEIEPGKYIFYFNNRILAFQLLKEEYLNKYTLFIIRELFEEKILRITEKFRRIMWKNLVSKIYLRDSKIKEVLNILKIHTFSDNYSLWIYNKYTEHFNIHCASFNYNSSYIPKNIMTDLLGFDMTESKNIFLTSNVTKENNSESLATMKSVNRFIIDTDTEITGVLSFYSKYENFPFDEKAKIIIPEIIELKLIDEFSSFFKKNLKIKYLSDNYIPGQLSEFLKGLLPDFIKIFEWEAASIFLIDDTKSKLVLKSLASLALKTDSYDKYTKEEISYDISNPSLTTYVYNENVVSYSYEISYDKRNTHGFDEPTINEPKNWIGVPIARPGEMPIGVLRVLNRLENQVVINFNKFDIDILYNIASVIAYICHIEDTFFEKQQQIRENLEKQEEENKQLNEFLKSFRHELKSPLTVITQASSTIIRAFTKTNTYTEPEIPKKIKEVLSDLDMVGNRLVYVTNLLSFEPHDLVKDITTAHLLIDIVTPVLAFAIQYAKNRNKIIMVEKNTLMHHVVCDAMSVSIAFHILIDNAIKYSNKDSIIHVHGSISNHICSIIVRNFGLPILQNEKNDIFLRYYRGLHARRQKTDGSGIGLYLAKEIMKLNNGDVILRKLATPTTEFELKIREKRGDSK